MRKTFMMGILLAGALSTTVIGEGPQRFSARLVSYQEVPSASSRGVGHVDLVIDDDAQTIEYHLAFEGIEAPVTQSHIHFGQFGVTGGIMLWLCGTATNPGPADGPMPPACPADGDPLGVTGILGPANVVLNGQGITPGEFQEALAAIRAGVAYVNVHSTRLPGGEIRGQLQEGGGHK